MSMNGGLFQLISQYGDNIYGKKCLYNKATHINIIDITNSLNGFTLDKYVDITNIDKLVFEFYDNTNINDIIEQMKNIKSEIIFIIEICEKTILKLDLNFLINLNIHSKDLLIKNNKLSINLCIDYFISELKIGALYGHTISIRLLNLNFFMNLINSVKITLNQTYFAKDGHIELKNKTHIDFIQQLSAINLSGPSIYSLTTKNKLNCEGYSKGFFIHGNINQIKNIKLMLYDSNIEKFNYDDILIEMYCNKISNDLMYVPFNIKLLSGFNNNTVESFISGINLTRIGHFKLEIDWLQPQEIFKIYICTLGQLHVMNGMGALGRPIPIIKDLNYN